MPGTYVLGNEGNTVGFFHLETREAHSIICRRLSDKIQQLESDIALEKCCCGRRPADNARREEQLRETRKVLVILSGRHRASKPTCDIGADLHSYADILPLYVPEGDADPFFVPQRVGVAAAEVVAEDGSTHGRSAFRRTVDTSNKVGNFSWNTVAVPPAGEGYDEPTRGGGWG
jgi:hypothetical protein